MSYYRVEDGSRFSGAHRPWGTEPSPENRKHTPVHTETEEMQREREACLACPLPDCRPKSTLCPVRHYKEPPRKRKGGRKAMEPPAVFVKHGMDRTSNKEWAEHLGVSPTTIQRWRQKLGYQRMTLKRKTKG